MTGGGVAGAAKAAGCTTQVIYEWLRQDVFKEMLRARLDVVNAATEATTIALVSDALAALKKLMTVKRMDRGAAIAQTTAIKIALEHYRWTFEKAALRNTPAGVGAAATAGIVVKVQAMTADEVAAAREYSRLLHVRAGDEDIAE